MIKTIALDIAGGATGWCYAEGTTLKEYGKFISNQRHCKGRRLQDFSSFLEEIFLKYQPEIILIERPFLGRNSGVLANLSKFVAMAEYTAYKILGLELEDEWFLDPKFIKRQLKIKPPKKRSDKKEPKDNKKLMVDKINKLYGLNLKYKKGKGKKYNDDDIADACAVFAAWIRKNKVKI